MERFYMVLVEGTDHISFQHRTLEEAKVEAERLLAQPRNQGKGAYILGSILYGKPQVPPVFWMSVGHSVFMEPMG